MKVDLDCRGMACPKPLVMTKKEIESGHYNVSVCVDNETAVKNLTRLAEKSHLDLEITPLEEGWIMQFSSRDNGLVLSDGTRARSAAPEGEEQTSLPVSEGQACTPCGCGWSVFIGKDHIGDGSHELGYNLMKMALYTLSESDDVPASVLFMNAGVTLVAGNEEEHKQIVENLHTLQNKGTEILVCGTCLNYYGLDGQLLIGEVSNMYDILERMKEAAKVITL